MAAKPLLPENEGVTYNKVTDFEGTGPQQSDANRPNQRLNTPRDVRISYQNEPDRTEKAASAMQSSGRAMQATGTGTRIAGNSMRVAGKTADVAGKGMMRAGAALSSTGVGAIVGVPLAAIGGVTTAGGKATAAAGKQVNRTGRNISRRGRRMVKTGKRLNATSKKQGTVRKKAKATRATMTVLSVGFGVFYVMQLFLGLAYLITFGILGALDTRIVGDTVLAKVGNIVLDFAESTLTALMDYFNFDVAGLFITTFALCLLWGFITLLTLSFIYMVQGVKPLGGRGAGLKNSLFLFTLISYVLPILNMLPVFTLWIFGVWKNPK